MNTLDMHRNLAIAFCSVFRFEGVPVEGVTGAAIADCRPPGKPADAGWRPAMWSPVSRQIFLAVFILTGCGCALAQLFPGRITGTIRDLLGAERGGCTVTLTAPEIGQQRSHRSDPRGYFQLPALPFS